MRGHTLNIDKVKVFRGSKSRVGVGVVADKAIGT